MEIGHSVTLLGGKKSATARQRVTHPIDYLDARMWISSFQRSARHGSDRNTAKSARPSPW